jgi:hypothetical protein
LAVVFQLAVVGQGNRWARCIRLAALDPVDDGVEPFPTALFWPWMVAAGAAEGAIPRE